MEKEERQSKAKSLLKKNHPKDIVAWYSKKFKINESAATIELYELGYYEEIQINYYQKNNIDWEYKYDGFSGELKAVPKGTEDSDLHLYN